MTTKEFRMRIDDIKKQAHDILDEDNDKWNKLISSITKLVRELEETDDKNFKLTRDHLVDASINIDFEMRGGLALSEFEEYLNIDSSKFVE